MLDMEFLPRTRGRAAKPLTADILGDLNEADFAALATEKGSVAPAIKRISDRHHQLARNIASGMDMTQAGVISGYSASRVSILKADPAFKELVEFYRTDVDLAYRDLHQQLSGLALDATAEISDRLELEPEKFTVGQLLEVAKLGADRTGHGPTSAGPVTNNNFVVHVPLKQPDEATWLAAHQPVIEHKGN